MRDKYYNLLKEHNLPDAFYEIDYLSYTKKYDILKHFIEKNTIEDLKYALDIYRRDYLLLNKYNHSFIINTIQSIINRRSK